MFIFKPDIFRPSNAAAAGPKPGKMQTGGNEHARRKQRWKHLLSVCWQWLEDMQLEWHRRSRGDKTMLQAADFAGFNKPKRSALERQPWDGLPALTMADQKGKL